MFILIIFFSYLLGSFNSAIIICKLMNLQSPLSFGSGNAGSTNILRLGGKKLGFITLFLDIIKGFIPIYIVKNFFGFHPIDLGYISLSIIVGHIFPIFFKFKGGKGFATFIGVLLAFHPLIGIFCLLSWLFTAIITKYSSLSSIFSTFISVFFILFIFDLNTFFPFLMIKIIIISCHYSNIKSLINGSENKIGQNKNA